MSETTEHTGTLQILPLDAIHVGERHRKQQGDIKALAASIADVGLLHPVVVTPGNKLVAGYRRLLAAKELGWTSIPVTVVKNLTDATQALKAERDENVCQVNLLPEEAVAIGLALEMIEGTKAREPQVRAGPKEGKGKKRSACGNLPEALGDTRDLVGSGSRRTLDTLSPGR